MGRFHLFALSIACLVVVLSMASEPTSVHEDPAETASAQTVPSERPPAAAAEWVRRAPLPERRTEVSATTDGRHIFLAGGFGPPAGPERATAPRTVWRYDPQADAWSPLTRLPQGVHHAPFQYHQGRLYLLGGFREITFEPIGDVHIYDLESGRWSEGAPMLTPRGAAGWAVVEGRIHVVGGTAAGPEAVRNRAGVRITDDSSVNVHEVYDPATDRWTARAPMPTPRNHLGVAAVGGRLHAVLGRADGDYTMTVHEVYDPATNAWRTAPAVPTGRSGVAVLEHGGLVYTFGGERLDAPYRRTFADAERFDPVAGRWERLGLMPTARHGLGAAAIGDSIYVIAGGPGPAFTFGDANERLDLTP